MLYTKRFLFLPLMLCYAFVAQAQVLINEYSAANKSNYINNGDYYDWIELYNAGSTSVNIGGYHLTDNRMDPMKYTIPTGINLPAGGYRIFICSGDSGFFGGQYHTNFSLTQSNYTEEVCLTNAAGVFLDSLSIIPCRKNHSRGRAPNGSPNWRVFQTPTPIASNTTQTAYIEYVPKPVFSVVAGFYAGTQTLTLTCPQANTNIYYTTNGIVPTSTPSATNFLYTGPITISTTQTIRAAAYDIGTTYARSFTVTNTFFINEPAHTYPIWSVCGNMITGGSAFFNTGAETEVSVEYFGTDNVRIFQMEGDVRKHGNDSWAYDQQGMRFYVRDEYGYANKMHHKFFPTSPRMDFDVIIIKAAGSDNFPDGGSAPPNRVTHNRDAYVQTLAEKFNLNVDVRRLKNALTFVNGGYYGIYETRERVDVDYTEYYYGAEEKWVDMLEYWGGMQIVAGSDTGWINLFNYITTNNMATAANYNYAISKLDPLSLIDYIVLNTYTVNSDWLNYNTAWWRSREPGNEVRWRYKLWDQDNTFNLGENYTGLPNTGNTASPCDVQSTTPYNTTSNPNIGHIRIFNRLMANPNFEQLYITRYADLINTAFVCQSMLNHFDTMMNRLTTEMPRHITKWGSSMAQRTTNINFTRTQIAGRCNNVVTGLGPCYSVTGPYNLTVNVSPACAGKIKLNTIIPDEYPFHATYYGGITTTLEAVPASGWQFSHWTTVSHTLNPNANADSVWFDLGTSGDSIVAVFTQVTPTPGNLTVQIVGNNPGLVTINGTPVTNGQVLPYILGTQLNVAATPVPSCTFYKWELHHSLIYPVDTLETGYFCFREADTLKVTFDQCNVIDTNYLTVIVVQPGYGNVTINSIPVPAPITVPIPDNTLLNLLATANPGYTFSNWTMAHHSVSPNSNSPTGSFTMTEDDTLYAYFEAPDTFNLTVNVNPLAGGNVSVNGNTPSSYPTVLRFVDGTPLNVIATALTGYNFSNWTLLHHTLTPNNTTANANFTITADDTLTALFTLIPVIDSFDLTVLVNPIPGGNVSINGVTPPSYPTVYRYETGTSLNVIASQNGGYTFTNWTLLHHPLTPNNTTANASFNITADDTLIANFSLIPVPDTFNLTVLVNPGAGGNVSVNGTTPPSYPTVLQFVDGTPLNVIASQNGGYAFANWTLLHHTLTPNNTTANASFNITADDTLIANFTLIPVPDTFNLTVLTNPVGGGNVSVNGTTPSSYPTVMQFVDGTPLNVIASQNGGYAFANWTLLHHTLTPNNNSANASFNITADDTLIANFTLIPVPDTFSLTVLVNPIAGGNVSVNGTTPPSYPVVLQFVDGTPVNVTATALVGYNFTNWVLLHHALTPSNITANAAFNITANDTLIANFALIPTNDTFLIVVQAFPAAGGSVTVNGTTYSNYPASLIIPDGTLLNVSATANTGFNFLSWHVVYQTPLPNDQANPMSFTVHQADTIYAFFEQIPIHELVVQAVPANGGSVTVNGNTYTSFPQLVSGVLDGTNIDASYNVNPGFSFVNWQLLNHTALPTDTSNPINFVINQSDTLYAYFRRDSFAITVLVEPNVLAGDVKVSGFTPATYPYTFTVEEGLNIDFEAIGNVVNATNRTYNYVFDHYDFIYHSPTPDSLTPIVFIQVVSPDTVIAYFVDKPIETDTSLSVWVPSAFTPDGVNSVFRVHPRSEVLSEYAMQIYNRWGQKVFESNSQQHGWNGEFNQKPCPLGVYSYMLTGKRMNGDDVFMKGTVTLIR